MSDLADLFPGFSSHHIGTPNGHIFARAGGQGEPLILVHGYPQTHAMWHKIAPELAQYFRVIVFDLRGYGWSSVVRGSKAGSGYSKRAMGEDILAIAEEFGIATFRLAGMIAAGASPIVSRSITRAGWKGSLFSISCRPNRVGSHPCRCDKLSALAVPRRACAGTRDGNREGPHRLAGFLPCEWSAAGDLMAFDRRALNAYHAFFNEPSRIHATCEDYRAGATIDDAHDRASLAAGETIRCPTLALWGASGIPGKGVSPLEAWKDFAPHATGEPIASGHFLAEENPEETLRALKAFLA